MQFNPNSLKYIVSSIILNEVEKKGITIEDLLHAYKVNKSPNKKPYHTFYFTSRKYFMHSGKQPVDKDWETDGDLYVISGTWAFPHFDYSTFPLVNYFSHCKLLCFFKYPFLLYSQ